MVAFNFRPQFVEPIRAGTKTQTIRTTRRCQPDEPMHLYTGMRTKGCTLIALRPCVTVDYVHLSPSGLTLGDVRKHPRDIDEFAQLDGFPTFEAMWAWFAEAYGESHFLGTVHRWGPGEISAGGGG